MLREPHQRPIHLKAAVEAGKHVFIEKPVAADPVGARSEIAISETAAKKNLAVVAGAQRRHEPKYREMVKTVSGCLAARHLFVGLSRPALM